MTDNPATLIGAVPFKKACDPKGGPNKIPISVAQGYIELKAGRIRTFMVGNRRYMTFAAMDDYHREREAETLAAE